MISRTYGDLKGELARIAAVTGLSITDPRMLVRVNEAIQELISEGAWPGVVDRFYLRTTDGMIVLPSHLDMLLEITTNGVPQQIMSNYAEFLAYGPGIQEDLLGRGNNFPNRRWCSCASGDVFDRGESPVHTDIPVSNGSSCVCTDGTGSAWDGPWKIRQYADPNRNETAGSYSTIQGLDPDGFVIRTDISNGSGTEWINGERVEITSGSSFVETTQNFSKITAYTKPETNGYIRITAYNGTTEVELSNYDPWETTPSFHRYFSPFLQSRRHAENPCCRVVLARVRRRFVPVKEDTDVLIISNVMALKSILMAQAKREAGDYESYAVLKATAVDLMRKESVSYLGKVRTPALSFQRGFSLGELPALR